jgi:hypothetical protein
MVKLCGVYVLVSRRRVIYVGSSIDIANRISGHRSAKRHERVFWFPIPADRLLAYEGALIRALWPRLNWGACVTYRGGDNEILAELGLPQHEDEEAAATAWREEFCRQRRIQIRWTRGRDERDSVRWKRQRLLAAKRAVTQTAETA